MLMWVVVRVPRVHECHGEVGARFLWVPEDHDALG
jgi:hypothetical protein